MLKNFTPRLYQETILSTCAQKNTLVVLPTGLGKTGVALLLTAQRLKTYPNSKVLFLAPTKPLAEQHLQTFKQHLEISENKMTLFTGEVAPEKRAALWQEKQVVFSTPQGLENDIINGTIKLEDVSLLVFDEAHRAIGDYSYVFLAKQYNKKAQYPRILALTASPGSDLQTIEDVCKNLHIEEVEIRTDKDPDVQQYIQPINISTIKVELPEEFKTIIRVLQQCIKTKVEAIKQQGFQEEINTKNKKELLLLQARLHAEISHGESDFSTLKTISLLAEIMKVQHALELVESQGISAVQKYFEKMFEEAKTSKTKATQNLAKDFYFKTAAIKTQKLFEQKIEHPKIAETKKIVEQEINQNKYVKILLFTQFRDSATRIAEEITKIPNIAPSIFVGQTKKGETGLSQKKQIEMLQQFKDGLFNVLVCTSLHPDEFIILKNPENRICIRKIGEFVNSILEHKEELSGWKAFSINKNKATFSQITNVHKHKRQSKVINIKLSSGFQAAVTEDHSLFSFNQEGKLTEAHPKKNLFVNLAFSAPNNTSLKKIDVVKELLTNPEKDIKNLFCHITNLSQAKIRMLSSELRFLETIRNKTEFLGAISIISNLDRTTITAVFKRLTYKNFVACYQKDRKKMCELTKKGRHYLQCLLWLFNTYDYHKRKYRLSLKQVASAPQNIDAYLDIRVGVWYGKEAVPRFLEMTPDLAEFLGIYVAEGDARRTKKTSDVYLAGQQKDMQERMIRTVKNIGFKPSVSYRGITIHNQIAYHLIKNVFKCGIGAWNKEIPFSIFNAPNDVKWKFLEGYFEGDGYSDQNRIVLTTVSRKLATGLVLLLRQLGIKKITIRTDNCFRVTIYEPLPFAEIKESRGNKAYYNTIPRALTRKDHFRKYYNFYLKERIGRPCRTTRIPKDYACFDYIKDITLLKNQPTYVYDISVKNTEKFFGGVGLINFHNSVAEEGLDIPKVDLVLFYEPVPSAIRTIQRRGRTGRQDKGKVIMLVAKGTRDEAYNWTAKQKEKKMQYFLTNLRTALHDKLQKKQPTLTPYVPDDAKIKIFADYREKNSDTIKKLVDSNVELKLEMLNCADYILSERVAVELKKIPDFVDSLIDGRLLQQIKTIKQTYYRPLLILEGTENIYSVRNVHPNAIRGMLATIAVSFGIPILQTKNEEETAELLLAIAKREQENVGKDYSLHGDKKMLTTEEQQEYIVSALPSVGPTLAKELLKQFKTVKNVVNALPEDLQKVEGVGEKISKRIKDVIEAEYKE